MDNPVTVLPVRIPSDTMVDGAVVELTQDENGVIRGVIRIPGPPVP